ncbi:MAG: acyl carrier protein [Rhodothermia bacterium]|nr:acyl carrier protein [Rhodothermia bacterium]
MRIEKQSIEQLILDFISSELADGTTPAPQDDLLTSGLVDSMGMMWLIQHLEDEFDTAVPPLDVTIENFGTVGAIAAYMSRRLTNSASGVSSQ